MLVEAVRHRDTPVVSAVVILAAAVFVVANTLADVLANAWWIAVFPGVAIVVVVLSATLLGRSLQARSVR